MIKQEILLHGMDPQELGSQSTLSCHVRCSLSFWAEECTEMCQLANGRDAFPARSDSVSSRISDTVPSPPLQRPNTLS
jgi:hypothetical protein